MSEEPRTTILRPRTPDPTKSPIETTLSVTELAVLGPDIFTNTRPQWTPPGARGIYGGSVIAQCLAAAQRTVAQGFLPHSCHCYFILAGSSGLPILFHVERVRDGRSFATRTVQAKQRGRCIFTTTISFAKEDNEGKRTVEHAAALPDDIPPPPSDGKSDNASAGRGAGPFEATRIDVLHGNDPDRKPHEKKCRTWMRARGRISPEGGTQAHLNALAYMSDSYFIGTVSRIHGLWRFPFRPSEIAALEEPLRSQVRAAMANESIASEDISDEDVTREWEGRPSVGMLVSLDHSIYFHEPSKVRADEWMFSEMESPWAGGERGVVMQRIFSQDGTLLASCVQEGCVRLKQDGEEKESKL